MGGERCKEYNGELERCILHFVIFLPILKWSHAFCIWYERVAFQWSGQLMRRCYMANIRPKVMCKSNLFHWLWLCSIIIKTVIQSKLLKTVMLLKVKPCMTTYLFSFSVIQFLEMFLLSLRWSYGVVLYEIFTIGNASTYDDSSRWRKFRQQQRRSFTHNFLFYD